MYILYSVYSAAMCPVRPMLNKCLKLMTKALQFILSGWNLEEQLHFIPASKHAGMQHAA